METSDSEYFESADEDIASEDENVVSTKTPPKLKCETEENSVSDLSCKIQKLEIRETNLEKHENVKTEGNQEEGMTSATPQDTSKSGKEIIGNLDVSHDNSKNIGYSSKSEINIDSISLDKRNSKSTKNIEESTKSSSSGDIVPNTQIQDENLWEDDEINWEYDQTPKEQERKNVEKVSDKNSSEETEDNLWEDDEIDWKTEGQLEKAEENRGAKNIKNQDTEEENLWQNDDWEPIEKPQGSVECQPPETNAGWGGWNNWGVASFLTQGVSTLTQGISTVIEGGMGIPDPEQMAQYDIQNKKDRNIENSEESQNSPQMFGLGNLVGSVSHITKFMEFTGNKVISGGLDTLETIGKKTMEVLQEGDPGLKKKRAFLKLDTGKPVLSQVLREAKEKAEEEMKEKEEQHITRYRKPKTYETLFDDYQGLVHLEALEMLSKLSNMKLQSINDSLSGEALKDMQETMEQVKELCELSEDEEDQPLTLDEIKEKIHSAVEDLNITVSYEKLLNTCEETDSWICNINSNLINEEELHQQAIETLAQTTALAVEQYHKIGELLLVKEHRSTADEADSLVQLTIAIKSLILRQAGMFTDKLSSMKNSDHNKSNELITNIFFEAANSGSYIQDAFQLLIPVLQVGAV